MRILFASTAGAGHIGPLVPLARACVRAGHEVLFATPPNGERHVHRAGMPWRATGAPDPERLARVRRDLDLVPPAERMRHAVLELFGRTHAAAALPVLLEIVGDFGPDVIVAETTEMASIVAAERCGVPFVRAAISLSSTLEQAGPMLAAEVVDELRASVGVVADPSGRRILAAPLVSQTPPLLDGPGAPPDPPMLLRVRNPAHGLTSDLPDGWLDPADERPLVYVSLGSEAPSRARQDFPGLYREIAFALGDLDAQVVMAIGDERTPAELGRVPENCRVEQWVPQAALMPHAAVHVSHGGSGSTLDALANGVPLAVVPLFADQPANAQAVAAIGAGIAVPRERASGLGAVVQELLDERAFRDVAGKAAAQIAALPPADVVVGLLEVLGASRAVAAA